MHTEHQMTLARQQAELERAEAKALNPANMQCDMVDDMGDWMEAQELDKALAAGRVQPQGVHHG